MFLKFILRKSWMDVHFRKAPDPSGFLAASASPTLSGNIIEGFNHRPVNKSTSVFHSSLSDALAKGPPPDGNLAVPIFSHGSLQVEVYTPTGHDPQKPHTRDEVYFVMQGRGMFFDGVERHPVEAGSFLFVPAGQIHRFEDFSENFAVWVVFYGPEGGEASG
jgi:mannose-6-phosphate isomerase-like protein (cupin superfamily)